MLPIGRAPFKKKKNDRIFDVSYIGDFGEVFVTQSVVFAHKQRVEGDKTWLLIAAYVTAGKETLQRSTQWRRIGVGQSHIVDLWHFNQ